jgi:GT2 family glycosyltransferase
MPLVNSDLDASIIIVSYNVAELLEKCLRSIERYLADSRLRYEVLVVDNLSPDRSVEMVRKNFPGVLLMAEKVNLGFSRGNNLALRRAKGRHIIFLNPDTELVEDAFSPMIELLDNQPELGAVGPKLLNTDGSHQSSIGQFTQLSDLLNEYFLRAKANDTATHHPDNPTTVDFVLGACLVVRGDVCRQMGGLDERYFMFHEETDMCLTLKERGLSTLYYPEVSVIHHGSKSSTKTDEARQRTLHENRKSQYLYFQKHYGLLRAQAAKVIIALAMIGRIVVLSLRWLAKTNALDRLKVRYYAQTLTWLAQH